MQHKQYDTRTIYLDPNLIVADESNEQARPGETAEQRNKRVTDMMASIRVNGQLSPVTVVERDVLYAYITGGSRVEAIAKINDEDGSSLEVRCEVVPDGADLFQLAAIENIHRSNPTVLDLALIVQSTFDRMGWRGKGGANKVASYLGMLPSRVSEYQKILHNASPELMEMLKSGQVASLDAALAILEVAPESQVEVAQVALAAAEDDVREAIANNDEAAIKPAKVTRTNVKKAVKQTGAKVTGKATRLISRSRADILNLFVPFTDPAFPKSAAKDFAYALEAWASGKDDMYGDSVSDEKIVVLLNLAMNTHKAAAKAAVDAIKVKAPKPAVKKVVTKKAAKAVKVVKPAKPAPAKKVSKAAKKGKK